MRANTKRMMRSSPLSGPQKRINFSKTPTKTRKTQRKTQLFKESATPESTTPEEIGLKVDFVTLKSYYGGRAHAFLFRHAP